MHGLHTNVKRYDLVRSKFTQGNKSAYTDAHAHSLPCIDKHWQII